MRICTFIKKTYQKTPYQVQYVSVITIHPLIGQHVFVCQTYCLGVTKTRTPNHIFGNKYPKLTGQKVVIKSPFLTFSDWSSSSGQARNFKKFSCLVNFLVSVCIRVKNRYYRFSNISLIIIITLCKCCRTFHPCYSP